MQAFATTLIIAAALAAGATAPPAADADLKTVPLSEADFSLEAVEAQGTELYGVRMHARVTPAGGDSGEVTFSSKITLTTSVMGGRVVFDDHWEVGGRTFSYHAWCQPTPLLPMETCDLTMQRGEKSTTMSLVVRDGTATVEGNGRSTELPYPAGTVSQAALFRIIPQLPRTASRAYSFPGYSEAIDIRSRQPGPGETFRIICRGEQTVTLDRAPVTCTRYTVEVDRTIEFYVDATSKVRQVVADNGDTIMVRLADPTHAVVPAEH